MDFRREAISGVKWSVLIQAGFQGTNFLVSVILARILLPEDFGLIGMVSIFIAVGRTLVDGGLTSSLIRTKNLDQTDYSTVFFMNLIVSFFVYTILYIFATHIADFFNQPQLVKIIRVLSLIFIINAFSAVQSARLNKMLQFETQFKLLIPSLIISGIIAIGLASMGYGVWSLVWKEIIFSLVATIQLWLYSKWIPSLLFRRDKLNYHFSFGYKLALSGLINTVCNNIYKVLIGRFFNTAQLGFYTRAKSIEEIPTLTLYFAFNRVAFPLMSEINNDDFRLKFVYRRLMTQVVFWIVPLLTISAALAVPLFRFLFTEKWLPAVPYFHILVLAGLFYPIHRYNLNICYVKGRSDYVMKLSIVQNLLTLLGACSMIWLGITGLLWSIVLVSIIVTGLNSEFSGKLIGYSLKEQFFDIFPIFLLGMGAGLIAHLCDVIFLENSKDILRLVISSLVAAIGYFSLAMIVGNQAALDIKQIVINKIRKTLS